MICNNKYIISGDRFIYSTLSIDISLCICKCHCFNPKKLCVSFHYMVQSRWLKLLMRLLRWYPINIVRHYWSTLAGLVPSPRSGASIKHCRENTNGRSWGRKCHESSFCITGALYCKNKCSMNKFGNSFWAVPVWPFCHFCHIWLKCVKRGYSKCV